MYTHQKKKVHIYIMIDHLSRIFGREYFLVYDQNVISNIYTVNHMIEKITQDEVKMIYQIAVALKFLGQNDCLLEFVVVHKV